MPKPKDSFNKLKDEWYAKLKKSGFADIEHEDGSINSSLPRGVRDKTLQYYQQELIRDYYYMCYHFLNEYEFESNQRRVIWEYHSLGISVRDISKTLRKAKVKKLAKSQIHRIINDLESIMKARYLST